MNVRRMFDELRFDRNHHMGLGDIRLTISQQDEVVAEVERLAARLAEAERIIEEQRLSIAALNMVIGGPGSLTTENLR